MIPFRQLLHDAPDIAVPIEGRLRSAGLALLGTVRVDGSPRVSPVEITFHEGGLLVGMMPASRKLADVRRDPRVCLLTALANTADLGGEGKLSGQLRTVAPQEAAAVLRVAASAGGFDVEALGDAPVFELVVEEASWQYVADDTFHSRSWRVGGGSRHRIRVGAAGLPVDVDDDEQ